MAPAPTPWLLTPPENGSSSATARKTPSVSLNSSRAPRICAAWPRPAGIRAQWLGMRGARPFTWPTSKECRRRSVNGSRSIRTNGTVRSPCCTTRRPGNCPAGRGRRWPICAILSCGKPPCPLVPANPRAPCPNASANPAFSNTSSISSRKTGPMTKGDVPQRRGRCPAVRVRKGDHAQPAQDDS